MQNGFCSWQFGKHDCHVYPNHPTFSEIYDTRDIQWIFQTLFILLNKLLYIHITCIKKSFFLNLIQSEAHLLKQYEQLKQSKSCILLKII